MTVVDTYTPTALQTADHITEPFDNGLATHTSAYSISTQVFVVFVLLSIYNLVGSPTLHVLLRPIIHNFFTFYFIVLLLLCICLLWRINVFIIVHVVNVSSSCNGGTAIVKLKVRN